MNMDEKLLKLTSSEITHLWTTYMNDSGIICHLEHELNTAEDKEIKPLLLHALTISKSHIKKITDILNNEGYPVPHGFKLNEDLDVKAPRLFSDTYYLIATNEIGKLGLNAYSVALPVL